MKRITADEVTEVYRKTGLVAVFGCIGCFHPQGACGLVAVATDSGPFPLEHFLETEDIISSLMLSFPGMGPHYASGFLEGFDEACLESGKLPPLTAEAVIGFRDGLTAGKAVLESFNTGDLPAILVAKGGGLLERGAVPTVR